MGPENASVQVARLIGGYSFINGHVGTGRHRKKKMGGLLSNYTGKKKCYFRKFDISLCLVFYFKKV